MKVLRIVWVLFLAQLAFAQQPATALLEGIVVQSETNTPLAGAQVELRTAIGNSISVTTDRDGSFVLRDIQPGQYRLLASHSGYVRAEYLPLTTAVGVSGSGIKVGSGERLTGLRLTMTRGAVISGRVLDRGKPVVSLVVSAMRFSYDSEGREVWAKYLSASTNDNGEFRIFWLAPGRYRIWAELTDVRGVAPALILVNPTNGSENPLMSRGGNQAEMSRSRVPEFLFAKDTLVGTVSDSEMHVRTYAPGTANWREGRIIEITPGAEVRNVDIDAGPVPAFHVRGTVAGIVSNAPGQPIQPQILLYQIGSPSSAPFARMQPDANGAFEFSRIPPGAYLVRAAAAGGQYSEGVRLELRDRDVNGVSLTLAPGISLSVRIIVENGKYEDASAGNLQFVQLLTEGSDQINFSQVSGNDGTLKFDRVPIGDYRVRLIPLQGYSFQPASTSLTQLIPSNSQRAFVKSIMLGPVDVLHNGIRVTDQTRDPLEITIRMNPASIEGHVSSGQKPASGSTIVLIPEGGERFHLEHKRVWADETGHYQISGVPPGDYKLFAWESIEPYAWQNPDFMKAYETLGKPIHVDEGKKIDFDLPVIR